MEAAGVVHIPLAQLRVPAALMLGAAAVRPLVGSPGLPCILRAATGIPCPLCGMTTSVTETVWLDVPTAASAAPMGVALTLAAVALVLSGGRLAGGRLAVPAVVLPVLLAAMWVFQLFRFDVL